MLGILKVAAVLGKSGVEVLDLTGIKNFDQVASIYAKMSTDIKYFCLTATTPHLPAVARIISEIRAVRSDAKIVLGGPHVTLVNSAYKKAVKNSLNNSRIAKVLEQLKCMSDVVVAGDGEKTISLALQNNAPKLIDADDVNSPLFLTDEGLEESPFPARNLIDLHSYHYTIEGVSATSLIAQLGCPFNCSFCGGRKSPSFRRIRNRSSENVIKEIVFLCEKYGYCGFMFYDDELNVNVNIIPLMRLIAEKQKELGVKWRLRGFIKSELLTDEQAEAMYQAGFRWILVGFESGSAKILEIINKKAIVEQNSRCFKIARDHGLKVKALMSIGHPGETEQSVLDTKNWLLQVRPDDFDVTVITCYPGTSYYDQAELRNGDGIWVYTHPGTGEKLYQADLDFSKAPAYFKGVPDEYKSYVFTDGLTAERIVELRDNMEEEVRKKLQIPFNTSAPSMLYEHSMGQTKFPPHILRTSG